MDSVMDGARVRSWLLSAILVAAGSMPAALLAQDDPQEEVPGETAAAAPAAWEAAMARGDEAWARRAEGQDRGRAVAGPIDEAIAAYEEALAASPENLEVMGRLLRAIYFKGDYTAGEVEAKKEVFGRGRDLAEAAFELLGRRVGGRDKLDEMTPAEIHEAFAEDAEAVGLIYYWGAIDWGLWGDAYGKMAAARQGVGKRIRDYAQVAIELIPDYEDGGPHRLLGRLHTEAPKIPFFTFWIDRDTAISELRIALEHSVDEPYNRVYLADAILRFDKKHKAEAVELLRAALAAEPRPQKLVEDTHIREEAKRLLAEAEK